MRRPLRNPQPHAGGIEAHASIGLGISNNIFELRFPGVLERTEPDTAEVAQKRRKNAYFEV